MLGLKVRNLFNAFSKTRIFHFYTYEYSMIMFHPNTVAKQVCIVDYSACAEELTSTKDVEGIVYCSKSHPAPG